MILDSIFTAARDLRMWDPDAAEWSYNDPSESAGQAGLPDVGWDDPAEAVSIRFATVIEDARLQPRETLLPFGGDPFYEADPIDLHHFRDGDPWFETEGRAAA